MGGLKMENGCNLMQSPDQTNLLFNLHVVADLLGIKASSMQLYPLVWMKLESHYVQWPVLVVWE